MRCLHKWSSYGAALLGYSGSIQVRHCIKCNQYDYRNIGCAQQVAAKAMNDNKGEKNEKAISE